ncbi:phosphate regulon transcriptional regulator PhoB [Salinisphaera sp. USBA-960]|uniref:phosphate regulon transcriptional regulator PhoB n=1 Tax=Salinisphaera orenii TaxID=856731 RepID=UPI000DBE5E60|nr:phosphate regulon transcriptional regulator PhoB [Salifodinibacter halophilus]NNC26568.1 phosphate regulon transcriptional regulator PhoB [Salifodinibacter halophilus]
MRNQHVLVVEDEAAVRDMIRFTVDRAGFGVEVVSCGEEARLAVADRRPGLVLLDWMLPDISGLELARDWRSQDATAELPIIMVTARTEADDRVRGLELGADDYITKPFSSAELVARVRAVLRRALPGGEDAMLESASLSLDAASQRVAANGLAIDLGPTEFRLLQFFMGHPERVYTRAQLLDRVWGQNVFVEERTVDVHIRRLRKALSAHRCDGVIETVRGSGYRFSDTAG